MATITGTTSTDLLTGTNGDDVFLPYGVQMHQSPDVMSGGNGADTYDLREPLGEDPVHAYIIDDNGQDGAVDRILGVGDLVQTASLGYVGFTTALRDGDDLIIVTPYKPHRFRDPSEPSYQITIIDHYAGEAVEWMVAGGISYRLSTGPTGSTGADLMAGTNQDDTLHAKAGRDYLTGNDGNDQLSGGGGNDYLFGNNGNDTLRGQAGQDRIYGGAGNDTATGGRGADRIYLGDGNDRGLGGAGNDSLFGQDGNDRLIGGAGQDLLSGGRGDDTLIGGKGGDTYRYNYDVDGLGSLPNGGHDVINDKGDATTVDRIELMGFYGPSSGSTSEAFARLAFERDGTTMRILTDGGSGSITVRNQFADTNSEIEELQFNAGYWTPFVFRTLDGAKIDIGDDRRYSDGSGGEWNEVLFGTDGDDQVFGDSGTNFIWLGAGADTLIYKESDPEFWYGSGGGDVNDIVQDFDITQDKMDFTELKTLNMASLTLASNAAGNATISWNSGTFEISDILIELRGVDVTDLTADHFVF